ncbi:Voltage-dependent calcium channel subunit alpha-2/delta-1 [Fukomys damarensis]|uniref:Voltage-dependent calcium channel subunit alpha-2/delta-1 n=1 Tax=Fukomys damarensis TaxID=885580 RepID=A0A091E4N9_FUKDA|nr:Voltage-dependent calcium channel subunit alpha-2/delta-1 [Fukomys damarensis]
MTHSFQENESFWRNNSTQDSVLMIKSWVDRMQEDLVTLAKTASGVTQLIDIYEKYQDLYTVEPNNARQLVEIAAREIEKLLSNRSKALELAAPVHTALGGVPARYRGDSDPAVTVLSPPTFDTVQARLGIKIKLCLDHDSGALVTKAVSSCSA